MGNLPYEISVGGTAALKRALHPFFLSFQLFERKLMLIENFVTSGEAREGGGVESEVQRPDF
jgi:hypothetical protein